MEAERASEVVERFLAVERIEPHAAARLRRTPKHVQDAVVARGSLSGTRDPTAVLMTRIKEAERDTPPDAAVAPPQPALGMGSPVDAYGQMAQQWGGEYATAYASNMYMYQQALGAAAYAGPQQWQYPQAGALGAPQWPYAPLQAPAAAGGPE